MKVFFHLNSMGRGGAERVVSILSNRFAELGHEVVVATQWISEKEYPLSASVRRISVGLTEEDENKNRIQKAFCRLFRLRSSITKEKPDLVVSFCCKANFRSAFSLLGKKIPLLVSVRNNPEEDYKPHKWITAWMEHKASGCVFQTPDAQAYFSPKLQAKSRIIYNPIDESYLTLQKEKRLKDEDRVKEIVTVGRITEQKNQLLLLKAFTFIADKYPEYRLKIYGDVESPRVYEALQQYVEEQKLQDRVLFMGTVDSVREEIYNASLFVLSSDYEGMPNALIEAMAMGLPCISTDCPCGGARMLIEEKKTGMLTPVGDQKALAEAMDYMLQNRECALQMGLEAENIIKRVHPDTICNEWLTYIEQLIK